MAQFDFAATPRLETRRLFLRRITEADRANWLAVLQSPGAIDYLSDFESQPDETVAHEIIAWAGRVFAEQSGIRWAIALKPSERMIGSCGFHLLSRRDRRAEIGYELHSSYWRQGIMSEAVSAVLRFCFDELALHRLEADVVEGNAASAALLRKAGFTLEGFWRERLYRRGAYQSLWQFGLLEPEYRAQQRARGWR